MDFVCQAKKQPLHHPLFLTDDIKIDRMLTKINPLNSQNLLSVIKVFCQCSLTHHGFSRLLCYDDARKNQNSRAELMLLSNFNPRVVVFIYISPWIEVSQPETFISGRKTFIGDTRCSIDTFKWLEYLLQSLGKRFIKLQGKNQATKSSHEKLHNTTITLPSYIFRTHTLILLASFSIHFVVVELLPIV